MLRLVEADIYLYMQKYDKAMEEIDRVLEMDTSFRMAKKYKLI